MLESQAALPHPSILYLYISCMKQHDAAWKVPWSGREVCSFEDKRGAKFIDFCQEMHRALNMYCKRWKIARSAMKSEPYGFGAVLRFSRDNKRSVAMDPIVMLSGSRQRLQQASWVEDLELIRLQNTLPDLVPREYWYTVLESWQFLNPAASRKWGADAGASKEVRTMHSMFLGCLHSCLNFHKALTGSNCFEAASPKMISSSVEVPAFLEKEVGRQGEAKTFQVELF